MSYNQITIFGNLGKDPETRFTSNNDQVTSFSIATTKKTKGGDVTTWFRVSCFGRVAEIAAQYLKRGSQAIVVGEMRSREYDRDGMKMMSWECICNNLQLVGGRPQETRSEPTRYDIRQERQQDATFNDNIPF